MSLLRQALKSRASRHNLNGSNNDTNNNIPALPKKSYARSIKSVASVKTLAASLASFYTSRTPGESPTAKRRRSPRSELGRPAFASRHPELSLVEGIEACNESTRVSGVSVVRSLEERVSLVVHHFGQPGERGVVFYGGTPVCGEVRMAVAKADSIELIEVWIALKTSCTFTEGEPNVLDMRATLWSAAERKTSEVQPGTYVFPFAFEPFPESVVVRQEEKKSVTGRPLARVPLPPSYNVRAPHWMGRIEYEMGLVIKRRGLRPNDYLELPLVYRPRHRLKPLPPPIPFPLIPTRDDWPFERELVGGWSLTPFGGRGRWNGEQTVEVEGLLGIPHPTVAPAGSKIRVTFLLWGTNATALAALASPGAVRLRLVRAHVMGLDALTPSSRAHSSRIVFEHERWGGVVWADGERERESDDREEEGGSEGDSGVGLDDGERKRAVEISMDEPDQVDDDEGEEEFPGAVDAGKIVKLHGSVCVPETEDLVPSFRYKNMAVEYLVQVIITHKSYNHISPSGPGIVGEAPVWVVTGPTQNKPEEAPLGKQRRLVGRTIVPLPRDVRRMPLATGSVVAGVESER